jgi:hypothetical protein
MFTLFQLSCVTSDIIFNFFKVISMWYCSEKTPFRKTNQREYVSIYIINSMPARDIRLARYDPSDNVCLDPQNCIYSINLLKQYLQYPNFVSNLEMLGAS